MSDVVLPLGLACVIGSFAIVWLSPHVAAAYDREKERWRIERARRAEWNRRALERYVAVRTTEVPPPIDTEWIPGTHARPHACVFDGNGNLVHVDGRPVREALKDMAEHDGPIGADAMLIECERKGWR